MGSALKVTFFGAVCGKQEATQSQLHTAQGLTSLEWLLDRQTWEEKAHLMCAGKAREEHQLEIKVLSALQTRKKV